MNHVLGFLYIIINHDLNINHSSYIANISIQSISYNHDSDSKISIESYAWIMTIQDFIHKFNQIMSKRQFRFFHFYDSKKESPGFENVVLSPAHFMQTIISKQDHIKNYLGITNIEINPAISLDFKNYNDFFYFVPTKINYHILKFLFYNLNYYI